MPIYGYECNQCGHQLEVLQSISDAPLRTCAECGGSLRKLLYPVGVIFKGSGFYSTDYKGSSSSNGHGSDKSADKGAESKPASGSGSETKGEGKSETKPEKKSDTKPASE